MIQNNISKRNYIPKKNENQESILNDGYKHMVKLPSNLLKFRFPEQKKEKMTLKKRIMIMRKSRKIKKMKFRKGISNEFIKLFDGYWLY